MGVKGCRFRTIVSKLDIGTENEVLLTSNKNLGLGFADRSDSFDLNVALQDHFKYVEKSSEFEEGQSNHRSKLDLGFKDGQTITINFGVGFIWCTLPKVTKNI